MPNISPSLIHLPRLYHKSPRYSNPLEPSLEILNSLSCRPSPIPTTLPTHCPQYHYCWPRKLYSSHCPSPGRRSHSRYGCKQPTKPMERSIMVHRVRISCDRGDRPCPRFLASRATPPAYACNKVRARIALLHRSSTNAGRHGHGSEQRDDANVVCERAVRGGLHDGPGGGRGRGHARGAAVTAASARR